MRSVFRLAHVEMRRISHYQEVVVEVELSFRLNLLCYRKEELCALESQSEHFVLGIVHMASDNLCGV